MNYFRCGGGRSTHTATKITVTKTPLATFQSNVSGLYIPEIIAYIQATQSGTGDPSPINPRTINGVSEVTTACNAINQWDEQWEVGGYDTTTGQKNTATNRIRSSNYIVVSPSTIYYFVNANVAYRVFYYTANKTYIGNTAYNTTTHEITIPDNCRFITFQMGDDYGTTYNNDISINYPATDTAYHAYTGQTATTALGGTYYGGYVSVSTGLLTVTHIYYNLADLTYTTTSWGAYRATTLSDDLKYDVPSEAMCDIYNYVSYTVLNQQKPNNSFTLSSNYIYVLADTSPVGNVCYKLLNPRTYQLSPAQIEQLLGQNKVFCSSGDVAVKYWKID